MANDRQAIEVLLLVPNRTLREALAEAVEKSADLTLASKSDTAKQALGYAERTGADVALVDVPVRDIGSVDVIQRFAKHAVPVVCLSAYDDSAFVRGLLEAGAKGYLLKTHMLHHLEHAVRSVASGGAYLDPRLTGTLS
jgi:two-component system response regulator DegU